MFEVTDEVLGSGGGGTGSYRKRPVSPLLLMNVRCQPGALEVKMCIPAMHRRRRKLWALGGREETGTVGKEGSKGEENPGPGSGGSGSKIPRWGCM